MTFGEYYATLVAEASDDAERAAEPRRALVLRRLATQLAAK